MVLGTESIVFSSSVKTIQWKILKSITMFLFQFVNVSNFVWSFSIQALRLLVLNQEYHQSNFEITSRLFENKKFAVTQFGKISDLVNFIVQELKIFKLLRLYSIDYSISLTYNWITIGLPECWKPPTKCKPMSFEQITVT